MLLADTHLTAVIGVDVHMTAVPPYNPVHPYIGIVVDPADYIPFLGTNVTINGLKRGVSDTSGVLLTLVHIPLVGSFVNPSMIGHESMDFFSSQNVFSDGPPEPKGIHGNDMQRHRASAVCNPGRQQGKEKKEPCAHTLCSYFIFTTSSVTIAMAGKSETL